MRPCLVGTATWTDPSPIVREDDEREQQPVGDRGHDEEIGSHDLADIVGQAAFATAVMVACLFAACTSRRSPDSPRSAVPHESPADPE
jgi:hypothetical protein